ncbi:unnamed protein product [Notodromas monacha]|uniref:Uncharacterized protein n=1 Tax=Notodromas monacha TaxID=399045 RepID=A0A7R9BJ31_9CRUS|nr:unnamed protein product [Notodromas monacha]CAG0915647.1 unnamed protein product [Notodromas monacha]
MNLSDEERKPPRHVDAAVAGEPDDAAYALSLRLSQLFDPIADIGLAAQLDFNSPPSPAPAGGGAASSHAGHRMSDYDQRASTASSSSIHSVLSDFAGDLEEVIASPNSSCWALLSSTKDVATMFGESSGKNADDGSVDWQERCLEMELALERFRDHTGKVRDLFNEKVLLCQWGLCPPLFNAFAKPRDILSDTGSYDTREWCIRGSFVDICADLHSENSEVEECSIVRELKSLLQAFFSRRRARVR